MLNLVNFMTAELKGNRDTLMFGGTIPSSSTSVVKTLTGPTGECSHCHALGYIPVECPHCSLGTRYCSRECLRLNLRSHNIHCRENYVQQTCIKDRIQRINRLGTPNTQLAKQSAQLSSAVELLRGDAKRVSGTPMFEAQRVRWRAAPGNEVLAAANAGDTAAMYVYGRRLANADGVMLDGWKAAEMLKKAGDAGVALAASSLGDLFFTGAGDLPRDLISSSRWHKFAAEVLGYSQSFFGLGSALEAMYIESVNGNKEETTLLNDAREAYLKAAVEGVSAARDAIRRLRRASGLPEAPYPLKVALAVNVPSRPQTAEVVTKTSNENKLESPRIPPKAPFLILGGTYSGLIDKCNEELIPWKREQGTSIIVKQINALKSQLDLYDKYIVSSLRETYHAANGKANCPAAQCVLGHLCLQGGRLVAKDVKQGVDYLEQSSSQNFALAQLTLGMLLAGDGRPKTIRPGESQQDIDDKIGPRFEKWWMISGTTSSLFKTNEEAKRGLDLIRKAASQGLAEAHFVAGRHAEAGLHTPKDYSLALAHFRIARSLEPTHEGAALGVERRLRHIQSDADRKEAIRMEKVNAILNETENGIRLRQTLELERRKQIESIFSEMDSSNRKKQHLKDSRRI
jgi:TPR repeat protein